MVCSIPFLPQPLVPESVHNTDSVQPMPFRPAAFNPWIQIASLSYEELYSSVLTPKAVLQLDVFTPETAHSITVYTYQESPRIQKSFLEQTQILFVPLWLYALPSCW